MGWFRGLLDAKKSKYVRESNLLISNFLKLKGNGKEAARIKLSNYQRKVRAHLSEMQSLATEIERLDAKIKAGEARLENIRTHPYGFSEEKRLQQKKDYDLIKGTIDELSIKARRLSGQLRARTNVRCGIQDAVDILGRMEAVLKSS